MELILAGAEKEIVDGLKQTIEETGLELAGIKTEFYIPPGGDIGSSCGQFLMDYYREFNIKK